MLHAWIVSLKPTQPTPILQAQEEADRLMAPQMPFRVEQVSPPPVASSARVFTCPFFWCGIFHWHHFIAMRMGKVKKLGYALLDSRRDSCDFRNLQPRAWYSNENCHNDTPGHAEGTSSIWAGRRPRATSLARRTISTISIWFHIDMIFFDYFFSSWFFCKNTAGRCAFSTTWLVEDTAFGPRSWRRTLQCVGNFHQRCWGRNPGADT